MKINFITPLKMQWISGYEEIFKDCEFFKTDKPAHGSFDVRMFMWCNEDTVRFINENEKDAKYIVFVRRYEYYSSPLEKVDWSRVDQVIMVNDYLAQRFEERTGVKPLVIYNGVNPEEWTFKKRSHGKRIAMVGFLNQKKNFPMALQLLAELPDDYELHIAGGVQDITVYDYIDNLAKALKKKVYIYGHIDNIDLWLENMNYLLSTAISEGNPNNVIESMAKGIKPLVHNWPGCNDQFKAYMFNSIAEAKEMISENADYESEKYRSRVESTFGKEQYKKVREVVCS
jgi:glycosyltransferase involved in cell wall biosynthesis